MDKKDILLFITERKEQLEMMAARRFSGRLTKNEVKEYEETYKAIHGNARVCFTCGNSAQTMALSLHPQIGRVDRKSVV